MPFRVKQGECGQQRSRNRVVQDQVVHDIGTWPWQVAMTVNDTYLCSGTLIGDRCVLTAATCFWDVNESWKIAFSANSARLDEMPSFSDGEASLGNETRSTPVTIPIKQFKLMFDYNNQSNDNDLAVVELAWPIPDAMPICLTRWDEEIAKYSKIFTYTVGWGRLDENMPDEPRVLRQQGVIIRDSDYCHKYNTGVNLTIVFCADTRENGNCDESLMSGGPLLTLDPSNGRFYQLGVTFLRKCGQTGFSILNF